MDISYKIILDKRRVKPNGIYPLKIRVFQNGITKEQSLNIFINDDDWDDKEQIILSSNKDYKTNTFKLNTAKNKIDRAILLSDGGIGLTPERLLEALNPVVTMNKDILLVEYTDKLIQGLIKSKRAGTALAYKDACNSLVKYGGGDLTLNQITYTFLDKYYTHMVSRGVKVNSIAAYLRSVRAIFNKAIKEDIVSSQIYPFSSFKIETEETFNRTLSVEDMKKLISLQLQVDSPIWHHRNYFLLSFCLVGINYIDLFTLGSKDIASGVIQYRRHKTGKLYSITITPFVNELLALYARQPSNNSGAYLLPPLKLTTDVIKHKNSIKQLVKTGNKYLKKMAEMGGIDTNISTYYARYTWANIAKKLGYSKDFIAEALGHEYGNRVTGIYLDKYETEKIDEANRRVMEAIFD